MHIYIYLLFFASLTWMAFADTFRGDQKAVGNVTFAPLLRHVRELRYGFSIPLNFDDEKCTRQRFFNFYIDNEAVPSTHIRQIYSYSAERKTSGCILFKYIASNMQLGVPYIVENIIINMFII